MLVIHRIDQIKGNIIIMFYLKPDRLFFEHNVQMSR